MRVEKRRRRRCFERQEEEEESEEDRPSPRQHKRGAPASGACFSQVREDRRARGFRFRFRVRGGRGRGEGGGSRRRVSADRRVKRLAVPPVRLDRRRAFSALEVSNFWLIWLIS